MHQRKNKAILIRTEEEIIQNFKKAISQNKVSTYGEGLKCLLTVASSEVFLEYQDCQWFSEYPPDSKHFTQCSREKGKKVARKREDCQACAHSRLVKVPMKSKERIQEENSEAQEKLEHLNTEIGEKTKKLEKTKDLLSLPDQLKKKDKDIADLKSHYEGKLKEEKIKNTYLNDQCKEMKETIEELRRQETPQKVPKSVRDVVEKRLSEQKQPIFPPQEVEESKPAQTIQRVTERQETKKERIIETVASDPFTNREIECPLKGQYMDIVKECKKDCPDYYRCPYGPAINKGIVPLGAKIRVREG